MPSSDSLLRAPQRTQGLKKASTEARRRAMNERRHELTQKIRKTKRSHIVARKRRFTSTSPETVNETPQDPHDRLTNLALTYIRTKDAPSLTLLQSALAKSTGEASTTLLLNDKTHDVLPSEDTPAMQLANTLAYSLSKEQSTEETKLMAARVLTNLAATENAQTRGDSVASAAATDNYYQWQPEGWCDIIVRSQALGAMIHVIESSANSIRRMVPATSTHMSVTQQCCWAIGNVCGDSQKARNAAQEAGVMLPLMKALENGLQWNHTGVCRNAAWALSNLARGTGPGLPFLSQLTPLLISQLLVTPEQKQSLSGNDVSWWDVAYETCWVLAFLTAREDEAVDALLSGHNLSFSSQQTSAVCEAMACRLEASTKQIRISNSLDDLMQALRMSVPCLRAVGNIATACEGKHVPLLLRARDGSVVKSLATLVELGSFPSSHGNGELASVAVEAAWAAGTLLCDAGLPGHASSTVASPVLMPVLSKTMTSDYAKLDLKREAISALWNAMAAPPIKDIAHQLSSRELRDELLKGISGVPGLVAALTKLSTSSDMDAVLASLHVLNALLRHVDLERVRHDFLEADGVDMLEQVCDRASQASAGASKWEDGGAADQCAEIAADLIDDLFSDEEAMDMAPDTSPNGTYTFGLLTESPQMFDFGSDGHAAPAKASHINTPPQGRGRGKPVPSWMAQNVTNQQGSYPW